MTTPQFIAWLDGKMAGYAKLVPPGKVLVGELDARIADKVRASITERIFREAGFEAQVAAAIAGIRTPTPATLAKGCRMLFKRSPDREWRDHIEAVADSKMAAFAP